ncbi:MAG: carboxypeptidase regulatory-like domain-containing protein [Pirellulales bacterium]|nr:carboxypeptidase regulatory-like domain-containing protein [Pirellulales bacterium]
MVRNCSCLLGQATFLGMFLGLFLVGCGGGENLELLPVSGKVSLADGPLAGAGVSFRADASKGNNTPHIPSGTTDSEGKYELTTGNTKGAPAGWYKVAVTPPTAAPTGGEMPQAGPPPFNQKYTSPTTTDLSIEVKEGAAPGAYDLNLAK